jgi:hypothetical protein
LAGVSSRRRRNAGKLPANSLPAMIYLLAGLPALLFLLANLPALLFLLAGFFKMVRCNWLSAIK